MLKRPFLKEILSLLEVFEASVGQSPLSVYLLTGSLNSPSISQLLTESVFKRIVDTQNHAAAEWSRVKMAEFRPRLCQIPRDGMSMVLLMDLEKAVLSAAGHVWYRPLDSHLRSAAFRVVLECYGAQLGGLEMRTERKASEEKAEQLYRSFCLFSRALSASGDEEILKLFVSRMNPLGVKERMAEIERETEGVLWNSRELIRVISGGKQFVKADGLVASDVQARISKLFG
jgi:hypothetical protein